MREKEIIIMFYMPDHAFCTVYVHEDFHLKIIESVWSFTSCGIFWSINLINTMDRTSIKHDVWVTWIFYISQSSNPDFPCVKYNLIVHMLNLLYRVQSFLTEYFELIYIISHFTWKTVLRNYTLSNQIWSIYVP